MDHELEPASDIDLRLDHTNNSEAQVDASGLTLAAVFGPVAFPASMPDYQKQAIMDHAERERDAAGDLVIDNRLNPNDPRQHQARADADEDDNLAQYAQLVRQEHEEREREEWARTKSTVGGVTMTGAEWERFAARLRNDEDLRRRLIEAFEKDGATREEAELRVDRAAKAAKAASKPPGQRDEDERKLLADRQVGEDLQMANSFREKGPVSDHSASSLSGRFETAANGPVSPEPPSSAAAASRPTVTIASGPAF